jgi:hypothetical protein
VVLTADRCQTEDVASPTRALLEVAIYKASQLGHTLQPEFRPSKVSKSTVGVVVACSCGWETTPQSKRARALHRAMVHLGEVLGEELVTFHGKIAGVSGETPDRPERMDDGAERRSPGGEGEPSLQPQPSTRSAQAANL